jgi:hypothetical protein
MKTLLALLPVVALFLATPARAWSNLQYRSTNCQVQRGDVVISRGKCNAGFAYDTAVRVIKYWWPEGGSELSIVGQQGTTFHGGDPTCLVNNYTGGDRLIICTIGSTSNLGIIGD